jgi:hypothetical protein
VWVTRDGGKNWKDVTPPELTAWSKITQISTSHFDDATAYVSLSRFRIDDLRPYVYRTHDGGKTWQKITAGLPDYAPVDTVREDAVREGLLFAGTENAVWVSFDDGDHWQSLQLNLPHTSMRDLWIHDDDLIVATHGRSFWILDDISSLRQMSPAVAEAEVHLFKPAPAYRVRRDTNTDTPLPADEPAGENPPDGAVIDYVLAKAASGPVTLEILDGQGKVVRSFSAEVGTHRRIWDLRYAPPVSTTHEYPIAAVPHATPRYPLGPLVLPGEYTVRLTANGQSYRAPLTVKMDPRVRTSVADLQKQLARETQLVSAMAEGARAVSQARSVREQMEELAKSAKAPVADSIETLEKAISVLLSAAPGSTATDSQKPALVAADKTVNALYKEVEKADAAPTVAQTEAFAKAKNELSLGVKSWDDMKRKEIPALNEQLHGAGLPELRLDLAPSQEAGGVDEE